MLLAFLRRAAGRPRSLAVVLLLPLPAAGASASLLPARLPLRLFAGAISAARLLLLCSRVFSGPTLFLGLAPLAAPLLLALLRTALLRITGRLGLALRLGRLFRLTAIGSFAVAPLLLRRRLPSGLLPRVAGLRLVRALLLSTVVRTLAGASGVLVTAVLRGRIGARPVRG